MKLFGTDGIRGIANKEPMTVDTALKVGRAVSDHLCREGAHSMVIGMDTRISGSMLACAVASGAASNGIDVHMAGVVPTPAVARLTVQMGAGAGIVISASHNPFADNGIKVFDGRGLKLTEAAERQIEALITADPPISAPTHAGRVMRLPRAGEGYVDFIVDRFSDQLALVDHFPVVLDCANGATFKVAPEIFTRLGAAVTSLNTTPDGTNINRDCGSEHPEHLAKAVIHNKAAVGFAFDGDGDRVVAIDEIGQILSGDQVIAICASFLKNIGELRTNRVVTTVMSNLGLRMALDQMSIEHDMTAVGDRYVQHEMIRSGAVLGGEDSGHLIFRDYHTTGDGITAALLLLRLMAHQRQPLSQLKQIMDVLPQVLVNVTVSEKPDLDSLPDVKTAIQKVETELGKQGRVLVRYSGTEPICRVMVEAASKADAERFSLQIVDVLKNQIGSKNL